MEAVVSKAADSQSRVFLGLLGSLRPTQWAKNLIVFGPLVFAYNLLSVGPLLRAALTFAAFCLASSAIYLVNDMADIENDRLHPSKRMRPIAAGHVSSAQAWVAAFVLAVGGLLLSCLAHPWAALSLLGYLVLMVAYSVKLKHLVIIDVFAIAAGFVLRAVAGALAIQVAISPWLYVCTVLLALFLGLSKRRNELMVLDQLAADHRKILDEYSPELIQQMSSVVTASTIMAYSLYTFSAESLPANHAMMLTIPFVLYGIFRYQYLIDRKNLGGAPELILFRDVPLIIDVLLWGMTAVAVLYAPRLLG